MQQTPTLTCIYSSKEFLKLFRTLHRNNFCHGRFRYSMHATLHWWMVALPALWYELVLQKPLANYYNCRLQWGQDDACCPSKASFYHRFFAQWIGSKIMAQDRKCKYNIVHETPFSWLTENLKRVVPSWSWLLRRGKNGPDVGHALFVGVADVPYPGCRKCPSIPSMSDFGQTLINLAKSEFGKITRWWTFQTKNVCQLSMAGRGNFREKVYHSSPNLIN